MPGSGGGTAWAAPEQCSDADRDGFSPEKECGPRRDCDDENALEFPNQDWYADCDGDTYERDVPVVACDVAGADALTLADHCTRDLCSPLAYRDFLAELHRELRQRIPVPLILHICCDTADGRFLLFTVLLSAS